MYRNFFSVGALTALSRLTGFMREMVIGALMGQSALADAYFVALRLPNQFRAIFGEGAFNNAYVPSYSRLLTTEGVEPATHFASRILSILVISQIVLLALVWFDTPLFVEITAPGFSKDPGKFDLAVSMTRITFPYLAFIIITTLQSGTLNANGYFAIPAFAPVLLNLFIIGFLSLSFLFPNAGYAASWGVVVSGAAQLALLMWESWRRGILERFAWPKIDAEVAQFFRKLGPAVIGAAGQQIAILVDTILASGMATGAVASINYADRLYQLPLGVIGVAAGTVLLPEMTRRVASGDAMGAARAQNRSIALSLALSAPFLVGFLLIPDLIIGGVYQRGAFDAAAVLRSSQVLEAYGFGLIPMVLIRSAVAAFVSRGDTRTPMFCFYGGFLINLALKFVLSGPLGPVGLAIATAAGAWINFGLLIGVAWAWRYSTPDDKLYENITLMLFAAAGAALSVPPSLTGFGALARELPWLKKEFVLVATFLVLSLVYLALYAAAARLFGRTFRRQLT